MNTLKICALLLLCCLAYSSSAQDAYKASTLELTLGTAKPHGTSEHYINPKLGPAATVRLFVPAKPNSKGGLLLGADYDSFSGHFSFSNPRSRGGIYKNHYVGGSMGMRQHIGPKKQWFAELTPTLTARVYADTDVEGSTPSGASRGSWPGAFPNLNAGLRVGGGANIPMGKLRMVCKADWNHFLGRLDGWDARVSYIRLTVGIGI